MVTFVPTYSKVDYKEVNLLVPMIPFLFLLLTMQTKLGAKINILTERALTYTGMNKPPHLNKNNKVVLINQVKLII